MMKHVPLRLQRPALAALCSLPLALLLGCTYMPQTPLLWWLAPGLFLLCSSLCMLLPGNIRWGCGMIAAVLQLTAEVALLPWQDAWQLLLLPAGYLAFFLALLPMGGWSIESELHPSVPILGLLAYIVVQFLAVRVPQRWAAVGTPLYIGFLAYLLLAMLSMNRMSLASAMVDGQHRPPAALRRRNLLVTLGSFGLAVLLGLAPFIAQVLQQLWLMLRAGIAFLISLLPVSETVTGGMAGGGSAGMMELPEASEPSLFAIIAEKIMLVVALILTAIGLVLFVRAVIRAIIKLMRYVGERFRGLAAASSEDYVDESVDTRDEDDQSAGRLRSALERLRPVQLSALAPRERIRHLYARLRRRHAGWGDHQTARETLPNDAAALYEKARYSHHEVSDEDAAGFDQQTKHV